MLFIQSTQSPQAWMTRGWKLGIGKNVADRGEGAHVEVTTYEVDLVLQHFGVKELEKLSGCVTFLGHNIVDMYGTKCDCRCSRKGRTTEQGANNEQHHAPRIFARRVGLERKDCGVRLKGVFVEQNGKVRVVGVCSEVIRDVRDMVAGFLENDCMEPTAGGRDDIGRISARWAWIPL